MWECFFFSVFWCSRTSFDFSVLLLTSKRGLTWAQCQSEDWGQRSCHWLVTWMTLAACRGHIRASMTGFSPIIHSSMSECRHIVSHLLMLIRINYSSRLRLSISQLKCAFWCVFTSACPPTLQRQCIRLELKMIVAGRHSYMYTISLSLKLRRIRSCLRWPAAESQIS